MRLYFATSMALCLLFAPVNAQSAEVAEKASNAQVAQKAKNAQNANNDQKFDGPRTALRQFLSINQKKELLSPEGKALLTGELKDNPYPTAGPFELEPNKFVSVSNDYVVGRVSVQNPDKSKQDFYMYMVNAQGWKLTAIRTLAQTGMLRAILQMSRTNPQALENAPHIDMKNIELTLETDEHLRTWFNQHRAEMDSIRLAMEKIPQVTTVKTSSDQDEKASGTTKSSTSNQEDAGDPPVERIRKSLVNLCLSVLNRNEENLEFVIGGITDNTVGFLYWPTKSPPAISSNEYIWVEDLGNGWYLFRTT